MGCTCVRTKVPRFKGFVVGAYPDDDKNDSPVQDAVGKLENYVASNPERIPRVCRKISKLLAQDERRKKSQRILVGLKMLKSLIASSSEVSGFVPHSIDICARLLHRRHKVEVRIAAADVIATLCFKIVGHSDGEHSCHLLNHSKDRLMPPLLQMCMEKMTGAGKRLNISRPRYSGNEGNTVDNGVSHTSVLKRCHHAGVVALGNIAFCLQGALARSVTGMETTFLLNLLQAVSDSGDSLKKRQRNTILLFEEDHLGAGMSYTSIASCNGGPFCTALLPVGAEECRTLRIAAAAWGMGAIASCVPSVNINSFLLSVEHFISTHHMWCSPLFPCVVFHSLAHAMEHRPQRLGFHVCRFIQHIGKERGTTPSPMGKRKEGREERKERDGENDDISVALSGVLQALIACIGEVRMLGRTPQTLVDEWPTDAVLAQGDTIDESVMETFKLHLKLVLKLLQCTYKWQNAPQLHQLLLKLFICLWRVISASPQRSLTIMALQALVVATPYARTVPLADRNEPSVSSILEPCLRGNGNIRLYVARVLVEALVGVPCVQDPSHEECGAYEEGRGEEDTMVSSGERLETQYSSFLTDPRDAATAEEWVLLVIDASRSDNSDVSVGCIVEVGRVVGALLQAFGAAELSFALAVVDMLQGCASDSEGNAELHMALSHSSLAALANCAVFCCCPKLYHYATDLLQKRHTAGQLSTHFCHSLAGDTIRLLRSADDSQRGKEQTDCQPLRAQPLDKPPVTLRIDMDSVIQLIAKSATDDLMDVLDISQDSNEAKSRKRLTVAGKLKEAVRKTSLGARHSPNHTKIKWQQRQSTSTASLRPLAIERSVHLPDPGILELSTAETEGRAGPGRCTVRLSVIVSDDAPPQDLPKPTSSVEYQPLFTPSARGRIAELLAKHNVGPTTSLAPPSCENMSQSIQVGTQSLHADPAVGGTCSGKLRSGRIQNCAAKGAKRRHDVSTGIEKKVICGGSVERNDSDGASFSTASAVSV